MAADGLWPVRKVSSEQVVDGCNLHGGFGRPLIAHIVETRVSQQTLARPGRQQRPGLSASLPVPLDVLRVAMQILRDSHS
jgi:hypothetical protein